MIPVATAIAATPAFVFLLPRWAILIIAIAQAIAWGAYLIDHLIVEPRLEWRRQRLREAQALIDRHRQLIRAMHDTDWQRGGHRP